MSSKIKVDTIENVAGSGNVSLGSGHNLVVPGTLSITGASTLTGVVTANGGIDVNGTELILDADADTSITADTDDRIDVKLGGSDAYHFAQTAAHGSGLGIGINTPLRQLHISNTSANSEIAFTAATNGVSSILFGDGQTGTDIYRGYLQYNHSNDEMYLAASSATKVTIKGSNGLAYIPSAYSVTTGTGANMYIQSDGAFYRSTSSRRYKNTIEDATHGLDELLKLRSVTYKGNNDGDIILGGLIAEEVHEAGLTEFVQYNDDNEPDALSYGNMVSLCIKAIQELSAKNDALEAKVKELETK